MKRFTLPCAVVVVALGAFATSATAAPVGGRHAAVAMASMSTPFTAEYTAGEYYGAVVCTGVHVVNKKYPNGADKETCEAAGGGKLVHMKAGKGQTEFENTGGGEVTGWDSDYNGVETHEFTYSVAKSLKKFKIIAIY
ncbi:MAG: hypothetical protein ACLQBB_13335 [Solirubrobacteraceae bacterium]